MKKTLATFLSAVLLLSGMFVMTPPATSAAVPGYVQTAPDTGINGELPDLTQYINMRIGTSGGGSNMLIGTQRPFGSASPGPDTNPQNKCTGYNPTGLIRGFSQQHVSGTGSPKYGQFLVSPQTGALSTRLDGHDSAMANEKPTCSEYSVTLSKYNIGASFTPAEHSTIYKFVYPQNNNASLLIDAAHSIPNEGSTSSTNAQNVRVNIGVNEKGEPFISGSGYYSGGWALPHNLYFYAVIQKSNATLGLYNSNGPVSGTSLGPVDVSNYLGGTGAYATFATTANETVYLKISTSFKSVDQAKIWLDEEIPAWDYEGVRQETNRQWNEQLNKVVIDGNSSDTDKQIFYTAVYHTAIMPRDRTGDLPEYEGADMIDDHLAVWDTWRTLYPLYSITNPDIVTKTVNSFIARYQKNGYVRDSFVAGLDMRQQQGGDNIDNIIADAYVKGVPGVDWNEAYKVVKNNADNYRLSLKDASVQNNLVPNVNSEYKKLGYIPAGIGWNMSNCSYTLEYAYNDFCAAQIAKGLGNTADYEKYLARSNNWTNIWNPGLVKNGYSGFIAPRQNNLGAFVDIDPTYKYGSWGDYFYEASSWGYSFFVPHDVPQLVEKMGGQETFANRLKAGIDNNWVDFGNEPAFLAAALFNYTDRPWMTSDAMAKLLAKYTLTGVPGNDDSGAMSSWYIFSSTGFFPNAGQDQYFITSPKFGQTTFNLDSGKQFRIIANNLSAVNKYIQSVTINGKPYYETSFKQSVIVNGGTVFYEMGPTPVNYTKKPANLVSVKSAKGSHSLSVNLTGSDWAHFTAADTINRKAGVTNPVIGEIKALGAGGFFSASAAEFGFSWTDGTPTQTSTSEQKYTKSDGGVELTLKVPSGSTDVTVYFGGGATAIEVYGDSGEKLIGTEASNGVVNALTLSFDCEKAEEFTVRLVACSGIAAAAVEKIASYTVTFNSNNGSDVPSQVVRTGGKVAAPAAPVRNGYVFGGWYSDSALTNAWDFGNSAVTSAMTLYAKWNPLLTITFATNCGSAVPGIILPQGSLIEGVPPTNRTGYVFQGWFINAGLTGSAWNFSTDTVKGNMTLYAKWSKLPDAKFADVTLDISPGEVNLSRFDDWAAFGLADSSANWTVRKDIADTIIGGLINLGGDWTSENVTSSPRSFSWSDGTPVSELAADKNFVCSQQGLELKFNVPAGGYTAEIFATGIRAGGYAEILDNDGNVIDTMPLWHGTKAARQFGIIKVNFDCEQAREFALRLVVDPNDRENADYSIGIAEAHVTLEAPGVNLTSNGNGTVSGGGIYEPGSTVSIKATPDSGYVFMGWQVVSGNVSVPNTPTVTFTMPGQNVSLKARFVVSPVSMRSIDTVPNLSHITLSDPGYADWAYLGYSSGRILKSDAATRIFTSNIAAVTGALTQENMQTYNSATSPYFDWTGGSPTQAGTDIRYILWNPTGLTLNVAIPTGLYEVGLYISGIRARCDVEVIDSSGNVILTQHLWDASTTRAYKLLNLDFDCDKPQTFTIRLLTDADPGTANFSMSIFAAFAKQLEDYSKVAGDVNGDGEVDLKDVTALSRYVAGWQGVTVIPEALDVNSDGQVDLMDVTLLSRYVAGWNVVIQ